MSDTRKSFGVVLRIGGITNTGSEGVKQICLAAGNFLPCFNGSRSYSRSRRLSSFLLIYRYIATSAPPEQCVYATKQSEMLNHHEDNRARHDCRRQRYMRCKVVQNDAVTGYQNDHSQRQDPSARTHRAMPSHGLDPFAAMTPYPVRRAHTASREFPRLRFRQPSNPLRLAS